MGGKALKNTLVLGIIALFIASAVSPMVIGFDIEITKKLETVSNVSYNTLYVGGSGPNNYTKIQDAINDAQDGYTIFVFKGTYNENITINKQITLIGENTNNTSINGNYCQNIIYIETDNVIILNFTINNSSGYKEDAGIKITSTNNKINNCVIYRTKIGIYLKDSQNNVINNCTFHTNGDGIFLDSSNNNKIEGCCLCRNSIGINIERSNRNQISYSYFHTNGIACLLNNSKNTQLIHCNVSDNQANLGGIFIVDSTNITIDNSIISHNGAGFHIFSSNNVSIKNCDIFWNTHYGVILRTPSRNIIISNCNIKNNFRYGFYFEKKNVCKVTKCNIYNNMLYGISSEFSYIIARNNWWGSSLGPSLTQLRKSSRIGNLVNRIKIFPWRFKPLNNIGANWVKNKPFMNKEIDIFQKNIVLPGDDSDLDGVPDWWEEKWGYDSLKWDNHSNLDPDGDALSNTEECYTDQYGSSPYRKDIFIEIDWIESLDPDKPNKPSKDIMEELVEIFEKNNITLHIDIGDLGGGEEIPARNPHFSFAKIRDLYWDYFLHNNLSNPRKGIFHYGIICNYCPDLNYPFMGWDNFDTFVISIKWLKNIKPIFSKDRLIVGALVHHLGHSLGLIADMYGGIDNVGANKLFTIEWLKYRNYKSCMNYHWKYKILTYSDGSHGQGDFDDWSNIDFSFFKNSQFEWPKS